MALQHWALPQISKLLPLDEDSLKQIITYSDTLSRDAAAVHLKDILGDSPQAIDFIAAFNQRRPTPPSEEPPPSTPAAAAHPDGVPRAVPRGGASKAAKGKRSNFRSLPPPRQVESAGDTAGAYRKADLDDYLPGSSSQSRPRDPKSQHGGLSNTLSLQPQPDARSSSWSPVPASATAAPPAQKQHQPKLPPSAAGSMISAAVSPKPSRSSSPSTRAAKVTITGGTAMRGASAALDDLDGAIRALELQTNPTLASASASAGDRAKRSCNCMAARHPLLAAAPNCTSCGKVICAREGLGPCTFCGSPLLSPRDLQEMVRILREERGREKQELNNASNRRADVGKQPRAFAGLARPGAVGSPAASPLASSTPASASRSTSPAGHGGGGQRGVDDDDDDDDDGGGGGGGAGEDGALARARRHRDRLLAFQASNARRTRVHDEAADFETPDAGLNAWASPQERAEQLKRQQRVLREQRWNARPEWEKRQMVVSIDVRSGKAVRTFKEMERPAGAAEEGEEDEDEYGGGGGGGGGNTGGGNTGGGNTGSGGGGGGGAFSRNPLMGGLIRPVWKQDNGETADGDGDGDGDGGGDNGTKDNVDGEKSRNKSKRNKRGGGSSWRRVQDDDQDGGDNEKWILDGGAYGEMLKDGRVLGAEEHGCG